MLGVVHVRVHEAGQHEEAGSVDRLDVRAGFVRKGFGKVIVLAHEADAVILNRDRPVPQDAALAIDGDDPVGIANDHPRHLTLPSQIS